MEFLVYLALGALIVLLLVLGVVSLLGIYWLISSCGDRYAPPICCCGKLKEGLLKDISEYLEKAPAGKTLVDLGSGWGTLLLPLAKKFPQHKFVGVERAFTPYHVSCIRGHRLQNLEFIKGDLFDYHLEKVDIAISFLIGFIMPALTKKFKDELPKGSIVYSPRFPLAGVKPDRVVDLGNKMETFFIYKMK